MCQNCAKLQREIDRLEAIILVMQKSLKIERAS